jgi:hypothetical protein
MTLVQVFSTLPDFAIIIIARWKICGPNLVKNIRQTLLSRRNRRESYGIFVGPSEKEAADY